MTDNEIIKALECCWVKGLCNGCPLDHDAGGTPCRQLGNKVFDLINRQQAENEDLNKSRNGLLRKCVSAYHEGYRYFAEKLCEDRVSNDPVVIAVKAQLEEMVGETK